MRKHFITGFALLSLLLMGASAFSQDTRAHERDNDMSNERFYRGRLFERVRIDLDRAGDKAVPFTGDRSRVNRAKSDLNNLQREFDDGRINDRELDEVIASVEDVVRDNHVLSERDRDTLSDDLARLREFRASHQRREERREERREWNERRDYR